MWWVVNLSGAQGIKETSSSLGHKYVDSKTTQIGQKR
jgi:hypothetical protein